MNRFNIFGFAIRNKFGTCISYRDYFNVLEEYRIAKHRFEVEIDHLREKFKDAESKVATILVLTQQNEQDSVFQTHELEMALHNAKVYQDVYQYTLQVKNDIAHQRDEYRDALEEAHSQYAACALREQEANTKLAEKDEYIGELKKLLDLSK